MVDQLLKDKDVEIEAKLEQIQQLKNAIKEFEQNEQECRESMQALAEQMDQRDD